MDALTAPACRGVRHNRSGLIATIALLLALAHSVPAHALGGPTVEILVNQDGDDRRPIGAGASALGPFASFARVQQAINAVSDRRDRAPASIRVVVGPGRYKMSQPLVLDGARLTGASTEIVGAGAGRSEIVGSVTFGDERNASRTAPFGPAIVDRDRGDASADPALTPHRFLPRTGDERDASWTAPLALALVDRYRTYAYASYRAVTPHPILLWKGDERITPGRWPRQGWGYIASAARDGANWRVTIEDPSGIAAALETGSARLSGFPGNDWAYESVPVRVVAPNTIEFPAAELQYGVAKGQRLVLENARGKDVDDRLHVDTDRNELVGSAPGTFELNGVASFAEITGAHDIAISGLAFSGFSGDALRIMRSSDISITDNIFERLGNRGIFIDDGRRIRIAHNQIRLVGEGGVDASGGDRVSLEHSDIVIEDNDFERFSEVVMTYRPAARIIGVGAAVLNNRMRDAPHTAIHFEGNEHLIKGNDISNVVREVSDSGAIYTWRDWTTYGTVIEDNIFSHLRTTTAIRANGKAADTNAVRGIYLDEFTSGITIRNNIFFDVEYAVFVNGGSDVKTERNIFVNCNPSFVLYPWGLVHYPDGSFPDTYRAVVILRDLQNKHSRIFDRYPALRADLKQLRIPRGDEFAANILINSGPPQMLRNLPPQMDLSNPMGATLSGIDIPDPIGMADARNIIRTIVSNALNASVRSAPQSAAVPGRRRPAASGPS
jgi:hypothetical protein